MAVGNLALTWILVALGGAPADVIPMKDRNIQIPIRIAPDKKQDIKEMELYISKDEGRTWNKEAVAAPDMDNFHFYAPADGLYCFSLVVVDPKGNRSPPDVNHLEVMQKILVDTLPPLLRIASADREGEDLVVRWEVQDEHPELNTLKLEYRTSDMPFNQWTSAAIARELNGQTRLHLNTTAAVSIRMSVSDQAGNGTTAGAEVQAAPTTVAKVAPAPPAPAPVVNSWNPPPPSPYQPPVQVQPTTIPPQPVVGNDYPARREQPYGATWPPPPVQPGSFSATAGPKVVATSEAGAAFQVVRSDPDASTAPAVGDSRGPTYVNSRKVSFQYEIKTVGPSGPAKVELWMTQNDGQTWMKYAEDRVLTSPAPLTVELPNDGVYGFRVVMQSKAGLRSPPPVPGSPPEKLVEVDTTPPSAQLYAPVPDPNHPNSLILTWNVTDRNLALAPITLEWSPSPALKWQKIATELANNGSFTWQLPQGMPAQVYLRLMAKDLAGNVAVAETHEAIGIDLVQPIIILTGATKAN